MNIQNRFLESYAAFTTQSERSGDLRVSAPPRRLEALETTVETATGSAASENPVDLSDFTSFQALIKRELEMPLQTNTGLGASGRTLDQIAEEVRNGSYTVDATATAARLNNLEILLR